MTKTHSVIAGGIVAVTIVAVAFLLTVQYARAVHPGGPAGYWPFDETSGTTALDSSGHGNDGAISGAVYAGAGAPVSGNLDSLAFDGFDDFVQIADSAELDVTGNLSISGWINTSNPGTQMLVRKTFAYEIFVFNGHIATLLGDGTTWSGANIVEGAVNIADGGWHHVAMTYDDASNTLNLYVDGVLDVTNAAYPVSLAANSFDVYHGAWNDGTGSGFYLDGDLDEVEIYSRVLTGDEIEILSNTSDTLFVDSDGQIGFGSIDCDGVGVGAYATIQGAVDAAISGDTIQVCPGTYSEPIQQLPACGNEPASLCVNKSLALRGDPGDASAGPGVNAPILDGFGLGNGSAIALLRGNVISDITVEGFIIRNYSNPIGQGGVGSGVIAWDTEASDIIVRDNLFEDLGWNGVLVGSDNDSIQSSWTIQKNIIDNAAYAGVELTNVTDSTVLDNQITVSGGNWDAGDSGVGIEVAVRDRLMGTTTAGTSLTVSGNTITGGGAGARAGINLLARAYNVPGAEAHLSGVTVTGNIVNAVTPRGIYVVSETRNADAVAVVEALTITQNIMSGNGDGLIVKDFVNGGGTPSHSGLTVNNNSITGNTTFGVQVENGNVADATCNWWGHLSGPSGNGPGTGDSVSTNVTFQPWLTTSDLVAGPCDGPLPQVTVTKIIINDNGGTATTTDFTLFIDNATTTSSVATTTTAGAHVVSETNISGYTATIGGDCDAGGNVTLTTGDNKTCTITNDDLPGSISGMKFNDLNENGIKDNGEPGLSGWTMLLFNGINTTISTTTDGNGNYIFENLNASQPNALYGVCEELQSGWQQTLPSSTTPSNSLCVGPGNGEWGYVIDLDSGEHEADRDFGNFLIPPLPPPANACDTPLVAPFGYTLINGAPGNDNILLSSFTMFVGNGGNDKLRAGSGNYIICTGSGKDIITLNGTSTVTIDAGEGDNTVTGLISVVGFIKTGSGKDKLTFGSGARTINAGEGKNIITTTGSGNQTITTGSGDDTIVTGSGDDVIAAGDGKNKIVANAGSDNITAGSGKDIVNGGLGIDTCNADGGVNIVVNCEL